MLNYSMMTEDQKKALRSKPMSKEEEEELRMLDEESNWLLGIIFLGGESEISSSGEN